ncbi:Sec-independent protein translocase protein TatB [Corynebacterium bovis]|uniref:Sec-independent protein translocase protein TatB n=1 Tax=Corynebacterium bovis TaxID=36808 RepID=A0A3R8PLF0_9CORY|nr:Sec-independent protein translocase protein TatB [Corynebacterium bovis]RRO93084.1 twin-arginine translocase subunit TatB [Corynebacterium bovis]RRO97610.1 twin-arginine translocase subunit TatB [Corynebacterium bovis]RRO98920.1 twin-arginine translocase subunit TatB [Corynebacterium bovis]RRQ01789.1 twin-arginine translocase subunit TatB [Corynebacterium bovis]RRQ02462.1 twin-arginine translocase subunit TatB [Corynebacterium bovis]
MFSNVGGLEIAVIVVVALVVIGPERLPKLIREVRAVVLAARNAINDAKEQLGGDFGEDFEELRKPLADLNSIRRMGARGIITKTLLDGDDTLLTSFDDSVKGIRSDVDGVVGTVRGGTPKPGIGGGPVQVGGTTPGSAGASVARPVTGGTGGDGAAPAVTGTAVTGRTGAAPTGQVEVPQQAEAGASRTWTDFDDAT